MKIKVLIVEDDTDTRRALYLRLHAAGYETLMAADGAAAVQTAQRGAPDIILLDLSIPGGDGFKVLQSLKQLPQLAHIPVVVLSARDPKVYQHRALEAGAVAFLQKPVDNEELLATIARHAPKPMAGAMKRKKILVVEDDADTRRGVCLRLQASGYEVAAAGDCITAMSTAVKVEPDLILLDLGLPGGDGFVLLDRLKLHPSLSVIPVVVLSAWNREACEERALKAGVAAFLEKPADNLTLLATIRKAIEGNP